MKNKIFIYIKLLLKVVTFVILIGFLIPNNFLSPIEKKNITKIDPESFWYFPWGESGVHKGIDIFCEEDTDILSPVSGFIYSKGYGSLSGNYLYILGPKWRKYYFAHLDTVLINNYSYVSKGGVIGKVGNTGNAVGKPIHLHFSIETIFPYFWLYNRNTLEGEKKMFYLDPMKYLKI